MTRKIRTRVLLLSDTHAALPEPATCLEMAYRMPLPTADVAIHTGDLTMTGTLKEHEAAIQLLKAVEASLKIVIPGNHDLTLDRDNYGARCRRWSETMCSTAELDIMKDLYTNDAAKASGIHYIEEGTHTFPLANGATLTVYASAYTPEFCDWAFAYPRTEDRFNSDTASNPIPTFGNASANPAHRNIDIVMTHGPPQTILDQTSTGDNVGCEHLLTAVARCRPLLHCFGHIHEGWGARRMKWPINPDQPANITNLNQSVATAPNSLISHPPDGPHKWISKPRKPNERILKVDHDAMLKDSGVFVDATDLEKGAETMFVNSSIMSINYKPMQGPWLVDLLLDETN